MQRGLINRSLAKHPTDPVAPVGWSRWGSEANLIDVDVVRSE
jgi:hypothetical protein